MNFQEKIFLRLLSENALDSFANIVKHDMTEELKSNADK